MIEWVAHKIDPFIELAEYNWLEEDSLNQKFNIDWLKTS